MLKLNSIDILRACDLSEADKAVWQGFVDIRPDLRGPYFDVRYITTISHSVPEAKIARLRNSQGDIIGFLPYQMRHKTAQPLGAPLSDYHGIIGDQGLEVDYHKLLKAMKADCFEFQAWVGPKPKGTRSLTSVTKIADLSQGYQSYFNAQKEAHPKFFKNLGRQMRNVDKDFGGFAFSFEHVSPEIMDWVIIHKRLQYKCSGLHDMFDCGWTIDVLRQIAEVKDKAFGLRVGVFRHEGKIVAAEICLIKGDHLHFWFPTYGCDYHRYSPGILLALKIMEHVSGLGVKQVDFGVGDEAYKQNLTKPAQSCFEGQIGMRPNLLPFITDIVLKGWPKTKSKFEKTQLSFRRRLWVIRACETKPYGRKKAIQAMIRRGLMRLVQSPQVPIERN
jgi:CelD/BcsL family acetyltransferase involved in cellulose biosynthesis